MHIKHNCCEEAAGLFGHRSLRRVTDHLLDDARHQATDEKGCNRAVSIDTLPGLRRSSVILH